MVIKDVVNRLIPSIHRSREQQREVLASQLLGHLVEGLPWTSSALDFQVLRLLQNDIVLNERKSIVEFGAGLSTVFLARTIAQFSLETRLVSFEQDAEWVRRVDSWLPGDLDVQVIHRPLTEYSNSGEDLPFSVARWYAGVEPFLPDEIDLVVVDGPAAGESSIAFDRYPALKPCLDRLAVKFGLLLDDTNRHAEAMIAENWHNLLGDSVASFSISSATMFLGGNTWNITP